MILAAQIVVLMATYYFPAQEKVQTEAGQYTTMERCQRGIAKAEPLLKKAASDVAVICMPLDVPDEHAAKVRSYEAHTDAVERAEQAKGRGLVL